MNPDPRPWRDDGEDIVFDADNLGKEVQVIVGRERIEDYLERETMTFDERLAFVARNRRIIEHNVVQFLRKTASQDATGIHVHPDLLFGCVKS